MYSKECLQRYYNNSGIAIDHSKERHTTHKLSKLFILSKEAKKYDTVGHSQLVAHHCKKKKTWRR